MGPWDATGGVANAAAIEGLTCPRDVRGAVGAYASSIAQALGNDLVGMYLYGSLAHGCFHPATSDVDAIVVTGGPCSEAAIEEILATHRSADIPVDATFVTRPQAALAVTPTPVEFVIKPGVGVVHCAQGLGDFPLQRQDVHDCDIALLGPSPRKVMRPVPWTALSQCLEALFPFIVPRFKNPALMLCRVAYAFAKRRLCSKRTAGEWALASLDETWQGMIASALEKYSAGIPDDRGPDEALRAFEEYCGGYIRQVGRGGGPRTDSSWLGGATESLDS